LDEFHEYCTPCSRFFVNDTALQAHITTSSKHNTVCTVCRHLIPTAELQEHKDESHRFCAACDRFFIDTTALESHLATSPAHNFRCDICSSLVGATFSLQEHKVTNHSFCAPCDRWFQTPGGLSKHRESSSKHVDEFRCLTCDIPFPSLYALDKHLHTQHPQSPAEPQTVLEVATRNHCATCMQDFHSDAAYRQHLASPRHNPICRPLPCVFCERTFSAPSALAMHMESGTCGDMTKTSLDSAVAAADTMGVVMALRSGGGRIIASCSSSESGAEEQEEEEEAGMLTPLSADGGVVLPEFWLHCHLCPRDRGPFVNGRALQQHLCSPVHADEIYHCPVMLGGGNPELSFKTLSGLLQHLEVGVCKGGKNTLRKAVGWLENLSGIGFGEVRLLGA
jgi:hypothetical protein